MLSCLTCASSLPWAVTGFHIGAPEMWPPAPPSKPSEPALDSFSPSRNPDPIREPGSQRRVHIFQPSLCGQQPAHDSAPSDPDCSRNSIHKPLPPDLVLYFLMIPSRDRSVVPHHQKSASYNMSVFRGAPPESTVMRRHKPCILRGIFDVQDLNLHAERLSCQR